MTRAFRGSLSSLSSLRAPLLRSRSCSPSARRRRGRSSKAAGGGGLTEGDKEDLGGLALASPAASPALAKLLHNQDALVDRAAEAEARERKAMELLHQHRGLVLQAERDIEMLEAALQLARLSKHEVQAVKRPTVTPEHASWTRPSSRRQDSSMSSKPGSLTGPPSRTRIAGVVGGGKVSKARLGGGGDDSNDQRRPTRAASALAASPHRGGAAGAAGAARALARATRVRGKASGCGKVEGRGKEGARAEASAQASSRGDKDGNGTADGEHLAHRKDMRTRRQLLSRLRRRDAEGSSEDSDGLYAEVGQWPQPAQCLLPRAQRGLAEERAGMGEGGEESGGARLSRIDRGESGGRELRWKALKSQAWWRRSEGCEESGWWGGGSGFGSEEASARGRFEGNVQRVLSRWTNGVRRVRSP
jgi:hypothetical protein